MTRILTLIAGTVLVLASCASMQSTPYSSLSENASPATGSSTEAPKARARDGMDGLGDVGSDTPVLGSFARPAREMGAADERTSGEGSVQLPIPDPPPDPPVPQSAAGAPTVGPRVIGSLIRVSGLQARGAATVTSAGEAGGELEDARMPAPDV
ncbi:MAG: hypothetical protein GVY29_04525, partial [Spirochaetes bacterium]|nr:hypothetical protein [Spirochaetota bacterium]